MMRTVPRLRLVPPAPLAAVCEIRLVASAAPVPQVFVVVRPVLLPHGAVGR